MRDCILLCACGEAELLPQNPDLPADTFTASLTTPIKVCGGAPGLRPEGRVELCHWYSARGEAWAGAARLHCAMSRATRQLIPRPLPHPSLPPCPPLGCAQVALRWFCSRSLLRHEGITKELIDRIPGKQTDRKTPLGELNWVFTAITDTIAWNVLPRALFQKLFRQASWRGRGLPWRRLPEPVCAARCLAPQLVYRPADLSFPGVPARGPASARRRTCWLRRSSATSCWLSASCGQPTATP